MDFSGRNVNSDIVLKYIKQRDRGTQGYGFAFVANGKVYTKRSTTESGILDKIFRHQSSAIMFHHRTPTSTENVIDSCHPFVIEMDNGNKVALIHNGVIYNSYDLFTEHVQCGYDYKSYDPITFKFNDSESLAKDFANYLSGKEKELQAEGWIAFIAYEMDKDNNLLNIYFGRNQSAELKFVYNKTNLIIGSEIVGKEVEPNILYRYDFVKKRLTRKHLKMDKRYVSYTNNYLFDGKKNTSVSVVLEKETTDTGKAVDKVVKYFNMSDISLERAIQEIENNIQSYESIRDKVYDVSTYESREKADAGIKKYEATLSELWEEYEVAGEEKYTREQGYAQD